MFKLLRFFHKKEWILVSICIVFIVAQIYLDLRIPDYMQQITILVQTPNSEMSEIWHNGIFMVLCALGSLVTAIIVSFIASKTSATLSYRLKKAVFSKVGSFSMEEINKFSTSSLITRSTNDVTQIQMFVYMSLQVVIKAPILAIWAICKIAGKGAEWSLSTATAVILLLAIIGIIMAFTIPRFKRVQKLTDNLNKVTRENLTGIRVVRAFNAENYQESKFEKANEEITNNQLAINKAMAMLFPVIWIIMDFLTLAIYWIGAYLVENAMGMDKLTVFADMIVYSSYAMQVVMAFMMIVIVFMILPRASVSAHRLNEVLNTKPNIVDGDDSTVNDDTTKCGIVEFKNVSFKYPDADEYVLDNISFKVNKGETIAFIGSTGSGKSTLINLVPRFYDATEGQVLIDGVDVKDYKQSTLHSKIGYISQKPVIFSGTIKSNILFGNENADEINSDVLDKSSEIAQASEFINNLEEKYESSISQNGANLSGGQKQRLAIARALSRKAEILVFDDSFSALDFKTDKLLRQALKKGTKDVTKLIVAQRIGTIIDADKILVLDQGKVVGFGTHNELLNSCDVYKEIALSQLSEEELRNEQNN